VEHDFGVAGGLKVVSERNQFFAQQGVVVDLAIESDDNVALSRKHRLIAVREIQNGEAGRAERDGIRLIDSLLIRTPVMDRLNDAANPAPFHTSIESGKSSDSAHENIRLACESWRTRRPRNRHRERGLYCYHSAMRVLRVFGLLFLASGGLLLEAQATFGTVVTPSSQGGVNYLIGGATDLVLDEARARLYLVNSGQQRVEVYSIAQRRFAGVVQTDLFPVSAAMSRAGKFLYVTCHEGSSLNIIDLDTLAVTRKVSLPAKPEGLAVGADERVLITTIGTGVNNAANTLLVFDPNPGPATDPVQNVVFTPPPPPSPVLPPPTGTPAYTPRTNMAASRDGRLIVGFNATSATQRVLFVYESESGTILRSRIVNENSSVLAVSPDGSRFMAGLRLFDTGSLQVLAQQSASNLPYALAPGSNLGAQTSQGGSVFSPDGQTLYAAFNFARGTTPATRANQSQLWLNDPDNLLTHLGIRLADNLVGNMAISSDGGTIYALSESGFTILPVGRLFDSPIAAPSASSVLLATDQCGKSSDPRTQEITVRNLGRGNLVASIPPVAGQTAPAVRPLGGGAFEFTFNPVNRAGIGTVAPADFQIAAPQAVNIPAQIRAFQNSRDTEARAGLRLMPASPVASDGLVDMVMDAPRMRLYIANAGLNRVEIFDMRSGEFLAPVKVGQLPRSLALTPDGGTLYVANSGGESISIIDTGKLSLSGHVRFPALPFNTTTAILTPAAMVATERGVQVVMNNGSLWKIASDEAIPRPVSPIIGANTVPGPRYMAATPNGEFAILLDGNGVVYLYDALADEFVQRRQVVQAPIQGYFGPVAAGPRGQYFVVNGLILNQALTVTSLAAPGSRPVAGVAAAGGNLVARFTTPVRVNAAAPATDPPVIDLVDVNSGMARGVPAPALEGPLLPQIGTARVNIDGRTLAVHPAGTVAYVLTASGLSIVPLDAQPGANRPVISRNGVVSLGSYQPIIAPNSLVSIFGTNLGREEAATSAPLPVTLGGVCVTLNNNPIPLFYVSPGQINAQIPPEIAVNRYPLVVRSFEKKLSSAPATVSLTRYAPAVLVDAAGQAAIFHAGGGQAVSKEHPTSRDDRLVLYAVGLGPVSGPRLAAGVPAPESPLALTGPVKVYFDDPTIKESEIAVEFSGLAPGYVGLYQINLYVPWYRRRGEALPVTVKIGGVSSPVEGPVVPRVAVE